MSLLRALILSAYENNIFCETHLAKYSFFFIYFCNFVLKDTRCVQIFFFIHTFVEIISVL